MAVLDLRHVTRRFGELKAGRKFAIGFATPKEGAVFALDNLVLHKGGPRPDLAHQFIDFWLEGEAAADITNAIGAGNANRAAMQYVRRELAANPAIFPSAERFQTLQSV